MQAGPAATPAGANLRQADRVGAIFGRSASRGIDPLAIITPSVLRPRIQGRDHEEAETLQWKTVDLGHVCWRGHRSQPCGRHARTRLPESLRKRGDLPGPTDPPTRVSGRRMPIVTESEVAKSRRQAHDNDACGLAHGTITHHRVPRVTPPTRAATASCGINVAMVTRLARRGRASWPERANQ